MPSNSLNWVYKSEKAQRVLRKSPLICWDIYMDQFQKINHFASEKDVLRKLAKQFSWSVSENFLQNIPLDTVVVVTNPSLEIVFVTENMLGLNGYKPEEVIGSTPRMFQGKDTCVKTSQEIGQAIKAQKPFEKTVLNYCKDGSIYYCHIQGIPVFDKKGKLQNFIALERAA
uniref:PAS domain-containing protein n=1 Tax=Flavobacterium sp. TaxID=239 RepID=UPI0040491C55